MSSMFHMGWFLIHGFGIQTWGLPESVPEDWEWTKPDIYINLAQSLERAGFDYIMFEDSLMVTDTYKGTMEFPLKHGSAAPKNDPLPLLPLLAHQTKHIGLVGTIATTFSYPYTAARLGTTLDHLTNGRIGLNVVTASSHRSAQNYGLEKHVEHDKRYEMAAEWMELCDRLWESWAPGALVRDEASGTYVDHTKVSTIDFEGKYYKCRGPLNTMPGPQRRPVICQAGGSPAGKNFGARFADTVIGSGRGVEAMRAFRRDMDARLTAAGREPKDCKVLFLITPLIGDTEEEAREKQRQKDQAAADNIERALYSMSYFSGQDMSRFDPDEPLPRDFADRINGHQSTMADYMATGPTLRQMATHRATVSVDLVGTPDSIAAQMVEINDEIGGDGFLIANQMTAHAIHEISEKLAPALRRRGAIRERYDFPTFRENLLAF